MTNKDFLRKALSKLNLAGEDRLPPAPQPPSRAADAEKDRLDERTLLNHELQNRELLIAELRSALDKRETERGRAELELAGKASDFKSAVSREREDYKARCEKLEHEFSAAEKTLISEVELLREAVTRKDADIDRLSLDLKSAREKRKTDKDELEALTAKIRGLDADLQQTRFSLGEKNKYITTTVKALERVKNESETTFEKLSGRDKEMNELKDLLESAKAGVENLSGDLAAREREMTELEKARIKEPKALKDTLARRELENISLKEELAEALEKTALYKGELEARRLELEDVSVFNKSAISALREKDEEIRALEDRMKTAQKDLDAAAARLAETESLREGAARLTAEIKKLEQARNRDIDALEQDLNARDMAISELKSRLEAMRGERERGERLVAKAEELRNAMNRERADSAAERDAAERETAAREKALLAELQTHKGTAARREAEAESLRVELEGVRASHEASRKELNASLARIIGLEKLKDGADRAAGEIAKLKELHARELAALEAGLNDREKGLAAFNSESARAREEYKRLELELAKKSADFTAAVNMEREEHRSYCDKLEKEFSSREKLLLASLHGLRESAGHKDAELERLGLELKSARELHQGAKQDFEAGAAELSRLENLKAGTARQAGELKKLEEARARDSRAFSLELATRDQILAAVNGELSALQAEHARAKRELAGKNAEFRAALAKEEKEQKDARDRLEKEAAAREKALDGELQALKEVSARREAEFGKAKTELDSLRAKREAERKIVESYAALSGELEKTRGDAERRGAELARLNMDLKSLREQRNEDSRRLEFYSSGMRDLGKFREDAGNKVSELARLAAEIRTLREIRESDRKALENYPAGMVELENLRSEASRLASELKSAQENRAHEAKALGLELKNKTEALAAVQSELYKRQEERERAERELEEKSASFKTQLNAEREEYRAHCARLEEEFSAREKALIAELQGAKELAAHNGTEIDRLNVELQVIRDKYAEAVREDFTANYDTLTEEFAARESALVAAVRSLEETAGSQEAELEGLNRELTGVREKYEAAAREIESANLRVIEVEKLNDSADRAAAEMKKLREARAREKAAFAQELDRRDRLISSLNAETAGRSEELKRAEAELAGKSAEYKALLNGERGEYRARCDRLEKDFSGREKALIAELQGFREAAARKDAELDNLAPELKSLREKHEEAVKELKAARDRIIGLEKLKDSAVRHSDEIKELKEFHSRELKNLESELAGKDQSLASLNSDCAKRREEFERLKLELAELEKYRDAAARLAVEIKKLEQARAREVNALGLELNNKEQLISSLNSETAKRREEQARLERELAGKSAEFKALLNAEREDYRARCDKMEKEFSAGEKALIAELQGLKELAGRAETENGRLGLELKGVRARHEADAKALETYAALPGELEKAREEAAGLAAGIRKLEQARARDLRALELELKDRTQAAAALQGEADKRREESERAERELAGKNAELKALLAGEREEYRARCDTLEKEFSAREKALIAELQESKETAARGTVELERLSLELENVRERREADRKALEASAALPGELEKAGEEAARLAGEIKSLEQAGARDIRALELRLKNSAQAFAGLQGELDRRREELERSELELAGKTAEFKALQNKEREEHRARCANLEKEFSAREQAFIAQVRRLNESAARRDAESGALKSELESVRGMREADRKALEASAALPGELEKAREEASGLSGEIKRLEQAGARDVKALELELKSRTQAAAALQDELDKSREELERAGQELAGKNGEFKALLAKEQEEYRAERDKMENEFSAKEKALISELHGVRKFSDCREAEYERLCLELRGARERQEAGAEALRVAHDRLIELEKLKIGTDRYSNEIKKLRELHAREITALESELNNKEQLISSFDSENAKRREERHRLEKELAGKSAEFKSLLNGEREARRAERDGLEKEFSAREQALTAQVRGLDESAASDAAELENLKRELESVRARHEADGNALEAYAALPGELEKAREEAAGLAAGIRKLEQASARDIRALELKLNNSAQACAALQGELDGRREELKLAGQALAGKNAELKSLLDIERGEHSARCDKMEKELADKSAEFKSLLNGEREARRAERDGLEKEFSSREQAFIAQVRGLNVSAAGNAAELNKLKQEMESLREMREADRKALEAHAALPGELEKTREEAAGLAAGIRKLEQARARDIRALELKLKNGAQAFAELQGELDGGREERGRAERELVEKSAGFKSLLDKEREAHRAALGRLEKDFAAREQAFVSQVRNLNELAARRDAELGRIKPELESLREMREADRKALEAHAALPGELEKARGEVERKGLELAGLVTELNSLREKYEAAGKELESRPQQLAELEKLRGEAAGLTRRLQDLEQSRARDAGALELELKNKAQAFSALQEELARRQEERGRAERELTGKSAEFKAAQNGEREAHRAERDRLEAEFSAREKALIAELQGAKELAGRRGTELERLGLELNGLRDKCEADAKIAASRDKIAGLERLRGGADKFAAEIKKLDELHRRKLAGLESALDDKEQLIAEINLERMKRQEECERLELELAGRKSEFKSLLNKEREESRALRAKLEEEFSAREAAPAAELRALREAAGRVGAETAGLRGELESLRRGREADGKALEAAAARLRELEQLKNSAENSSGELKKSDEARERGLQALQNEVKAKEQAVSGLRSELEKLSEEHKRAETELAAKISGLELRRNKEREDFRADYDSMEKDFNAREAALVTELQGLKEAAGRKEAETDQLRAELEALRAGREAAVKDLDASRASILGLEKLRDGADRASAEIKALKELHARELGGKERLLASLESELAKREEDCARLEAELAGKESDFNALLGREREAYRADYDSLERDLAARETALLAELRGLKEAVDRQEAKLAALEKEFTAREKALLGELERLKEAARRRKEK